MIVSDRSELRKAKIKARNNLTAENRALFSGQIVARILCSKAFQNAHTIMLYRAVKGEVCLKELEVAAKKQGKKLVFPLCINKSEMIALEPHHDLAWKKGFCGIEEPSLEESTVILPEKIDFIICPCTVFDETGGRMGMGAGFYDRFLPKCENACITAAAFEAQKAAHVPMESWDQKMHIVFTEEMTYYIS